MAMLDHSAQYPPVLETNIPFLTLDFFSTSRKPLKETSMEARSSAFTAGIANAAPSPRAVSAM